MEPFIVLLAIRPYSMGRRSKTWRLSLIWIKLIAPRPHLPRGQRSREILASVGPRHVAACRKYVAEIFCHPSEIVGNPWHCVANAAACKRPLSGEALRLGEQLRDATYPTFRLYDGESGAEVPAFWDQPGASQDPDEWLWMVDRRPQLPRLDGVDALEVRHTRVGRQ
jgi:hypothetical protein